ncbi:MAG: polysaccharide deacetylase family protein [Brumimicrobium sp.]|nr:polysaccharide deacetylase family protein [Brumimicrobium sp.]
MLLVYSEKITERLKYTLSILFDDRKIAYALTDDFEQYKEAPEPKILYGNSSDETSFNASMILFDDKIKKYHIDKIEWEGVEILRFDGIQDVLGSIFYVISLYDDYLQNRLDVHQRNEGKHSLLYKFGWLNTLVVERWSEAFIQYVERVSDCKLNPTPIPFEIIPTFDIDHAYAYKYKSRWRNFLSIAKDTVFQNGKRLKERQAVLAEKTKDPYDTFDRIKEYASNWNIKLFWLLGDYGKYDTNLPYDNIYQQKLIQDAVSYADIGLHPSYASNESIKKLQVQKNRLQNILSEQVNISRQHFLKVHLPTTYERLEKLEFTDDYSLGYADVYGFRAGIARPFKWFNLKENKVSNLTIHSISYMDGTLNEYLGLSIEDAQKIVLDLKQEVQKYGGEFIPLWHNETIGDYGKWKGWREVLDVSLQN